MKTVKLKIQEKVDNIKQILMCDHISQIDIATFRKINQFDQSGALFDTYLCQHLLV